MDTTEKLKRTKEHWEDSQVESLKDQNLRTLEIDSIVRAIKAFSASKKLTTLADYGCGDGYDTSVFAEHFDCAVGFDYSDTMLSRARNRTNDRLKFEQLDILANDPSGSFEVVVSKRFIINLGDWSIQSRCLQKISDTVQPGGILCLLECYRQGLDNLNRHRTRLGLPSLSEPYHNSYLDYDQTISLLVNQFDLVGQEDFSTYYYLTRCVSPWAFENGSLDFDQKMRLLSAKDDFLQGSSIGAQRLICFRKQRHSL
jgi:SAM-dependent methyltransferase